MITMFAAMFENFGASDHAMLALGLLLAIVLQTRHAKSALIPTALLLVLALEMGRFNGEPVVNEKFDLTVFVWAEALVHRFTASLLFLVIAWPLGRALSRLGFGHPLKGLLLLGPLGIGLFVSSTHLMATLHALGTQDPTSDVAARIAALAQAGHVSEACLLGGALTSLAFALGLAGRFARTFAVAVALLFMSLACGGSGIPSPAPVKVVSPHHFAQPSGARTREEASTLIRKSAFASYADALSASLVPVVHLRAAKGGMDRVALGASRLGGMPDLPSGTMWPRFEPGPIPEGRFPIAYEPGPLGLLAQIRLTDLAPLDTDHLLPTSGWLLFFFAIDAQPWGIEPTREQTALKVMYLEGPEEALTRTPPPSLGSRAPQGIPVVLEGGWALPEMGEGNLPDMGMEDNDWDLWNDLRANIRGGSASSPRHQVFGTPDTIQGPMPEAMAKAISALWGEPVAKNSDMVLLLQIDTDDSLGWMWGDMGRLYFWIRRDDLAARRFERTWFELQCY